MAKSLRSKWKRKMRAVKRERYEVKELKQLKAILDNAKQNDVDMSDVYSVVGKEDIKKNESVSEDVTTVVSKEDIKKNESVSEDATTEQMELEKPISKYHPKRLTNEHGNYPVWMNQRAIKKHKLRNRIQKKGKGKKNKKRK